jgi:hypothetical protein
MMLVTTFSLSEEEVECPELRSAGYSSTPSTTYVTERSVTKDGGNMSLQKACILLPDCTVSQPGKEQSKLYYL